MIELEVKLGPKTGLETVQNEKHAVVEVAPPDDSNQAPLVRVTAEVSHHSSVCSGTPKANFGSQGVWWWGKQTAHFRSQGKGAGVRRGTKFAPALLEQPPIANA